MGLKKSFKKLIRHPKKAIAGSAKSVKRLFTHPKKAAGEVAKSFLKPSDVLGEKLRKSLGAKPAKEVRSEIYDPDQLALIQNRLDMLGQLFGDGDELIGKLGPLLGGSFAGDVQNRLSDVFQHAGLSPESAKIALSPGTIDERMKFLQAQLSPQLISTLMPFAMQPRHHMQFSAPQPGLMQSALPALGQLLPLLLL